MNPEDELRSLRDSELWATSELQPRAAALAALRPRRWWLTARAVVAEVALVGLVAAAVVGVVAVQNQPGNPDRPVAVGPTLSPSDEGVPGEKRLITPATCTNLLDTATIARFAEAGLDQIGEIARSDLPDQPESDLDPFVEHGLACSWSNADGARVAFAFAPYWPQAGDERQRLLDAGAEVVPGSIDRVTNPTGASGGYAFGDGYWVYTNDDGLGDFLPAVFEQGEYRAVASPPIGEGMVSIFGDEPEVKWRKYRDSITLRVAGGTGCISSPNGIVKISKEYIVVHVDNSDWDGFCAANLTSQAFDISLGRTMDPGPVTVTVINDDSRTYTTTQLE